MSYQQQQSNGNSQGGGQQPPQKWLMDRISGESKYGERDRPDCPCCYVPPPVGWCPSLMETNALCRFWGWVGCLTSETNRCCFLHIGFFSNLAGCILVIYACLAVIEDYDVLTKTSFGKLEITSPNGEFAASSSGGGNIITADVGLRAAAINNPIESIGGVGEVVVPFDQFCDIANDGLQRYMDPADCSACEEASSNMVISIIIAAVTFLPTFFTDITRMYSGYDVNCQKCFVTIFGFCTIALCLNTFLSYLYLCQAKYYDGTIKFDQDGNRLSDNTPDNEVDLILEYKWMFGYGAIMLLVGVGLKFIDIFVNFCVRTPNVTRDLQEQQIYEKIKDEDF